MNQNVIKMARLMVGCKDRTCEDCLSQSKKLFGDNECALIEYAEVLYKAGYRKQSETVEEFIKDVKNIYAGRNDREKHTMIAFLFTQLEKLAEQYGKEV